MRDVFGGGHTLSLFLNNHMLSFWKVPWKNQTDKRGVTLEVCLEGVLFSLLSGAVGKEKVGKKNFLCEAVSKYLWYPLEEKDTVLYREWDRKIGRHV